MKKLFIFLLLVLFASIANGQEKSNYLAGAVPEIGGKVEFSKTIQSRSASGQELFQLIEKWMQDNYTNTEEGNNKILLLDSDHLSLASIGSEVINIGKGLFSRRQATVTYTLRIKITNNECNLNIRKISFLTNGDEKIATAEEMITDKVALNKKNELKPYYDNFRIETIDLVSRIEQSLNNCINQISNNTSKAVSMETIIPQTQTIDTERAQVTGYIKIESEEYNEYLKELTNRSLLILSSGQTMNLAKWGGTNELLNKPVITTFIPADNITNAYTVAIYKEAYREALKDGDLSLIQSPVNTLLYSGAWLIIECEKMVKQPLDTSYMYIGKIINVWKKK